jgi:hypothetical protein
MKNAPYSIGVPVSLTIVVTVGTNAIEGWADGVPDDEIYVIEEQDYRHAEGSAEIDACDAADAFVRSGIEALRTQSALIAILRDLLPYAESRAEDLDEMREQEDPEFPGADAAIRTVNDARELLKSLGIDA